MLSLRWNLKVLVIALGVNITSGCSKGGGGGWDPPTGSTIGTMDPCDLVMSQKDRCGPMFATASDCQKMLSLMGSSPGRAIADPSSWAVCAEEFTRTCDFYNTIFANACLQALWGTARDGECCASDVDCFGGGGCQLPQGGEGPSTGVCVFSQGTGQSSSCEEPCPYRTECRDGQCAPVKVRGIGELCDSSQGCEEGSVCLYHYCMVLRLESEPCGSANDWSLCASGLNCVAAPGSELGTCQPQATTIGERCEGDPVPLKAGSAPDCAVGYGLFCDPATNTCAYLPGEGEPCNVLCADLETLVCVPVDSQRQKGERRCAYRLSLGDDCVPSQGGLDSLLGSRCPRDSYCDSKTSTCVALPTCEGSLTP